MKIFDYAEDVFNMKQRLCTKLNRDHLDGPTKHRARDSGRKTGTHAPVARIHGLGLCLWDLILGLTPQALCLRLLRRLRLMVQQKDGACDSGLHAVGT
ncbi:MAG TPA: hypothetical protein VFR78_19205 [Pyrinomonadaceae bacterium]|nr:hypothetical protein [Pyrinomonadaceae bacterium]